MFEWLKKKPTTTMDQLIVAMYGDPPPKKSADLEAAVRLAHEELLGGAISRQEVRDVAAALFDGPVPYSTHDLALSVALNFFKRPEKIVRLQTAQLTARMSALSWAQEGKVVPMLLQSFESTLYRLYKP